MTGQVFHTNPNTGVSSACEAKYRCKFGTPLENHYETKESAEKAYEQSMEAQTVTSLKKVSMRKDPTDNKTYIPMPGTFLRGKTVGEVISNLQKDYEKVQDARPVSAQALAERIGGADGAKDSVTASIVYDARNNRYALEVVDTNHTSSEFDNLSALSVDYGKNLEATTWRFNLMPDDQKKAEAFDMRNKLRQSYEISQTPELPKWAALPPRISEIREGHMIVASRRMSKEEDNAAIERDLERMASEYDQSKIVKANIAHATAELDVFKNAINEVSSPEVKKSLANDVATRTASLNRMQKRLEKLELSSEPTKVALAQLKLEQGQQELKDLENIEKHEREKTFLARLSSRYPSDYLPERMNAALAWVKKHPEAYDPSVMRKLS